MFGYVQPLKPELKMKEYACYKSYYCGVCKALGKICNQICRFTVTYDAAFMALLNSSLMEDGSKTCLERCIVSPLKPQPVVRENAAVDYAAMINVVMAGFKLKDGWRDDKSIPSLLGFGLLNPSIKKVKNLHPEVYNNVKEQLEILDRIEVERISSIDQAADPFAKLMAALFPFPGLEKTSRKIMSWMGYNLGKWIYIMDAFSDVDDDLNSGSYNVLIAKYGNNSSAEEIIEKGRDEVEFILQTCLAEIGKAYELLDIKRNSGLLENIIFLGLSHRTQIELNDRRGKHGSIQSTGSKAECNSGGDQEGLSEFSEEISS